MQRQGQLGPNGTPVTTRPNTAHPTAKGQKKKVSIKQYGKDVKGELKKVVWPTKSEVINYSTVVLITLILVIAMIVALDYLFSEASLFLFRP